MKAWDGICPCILLRVNEGFRPAFVYIAERQDEVPEPASELLLAFLNICAAMLPEKLCHTENMAPGTAAMGKRAKWVAAREVARPEFCIPTSMEMAVRLGFSKPSSVPAA